MTAILARTASAFDADDNSCNVATSCYISRMATIGIRELNNALSHWVRRAEAGERVLVTDRGRVVAALVPAGAVSGDPAYAHYDRLVASGTIREGARHGQLFGGVRTLRLSPGTAARLIDEDRDEA